uniref:Metallothionein-like protein n=1 Tax=Brassica oleracea var. oleracea TaxID=109376 RepID=A0A0D3BQS3_BRAOL
MSSCGGNCVVADLAATALDAKDLSFSGETTTTETLVLGVAPAMNSQYEASGETSFAENDACKCGSDCKSNPCTCK